MSGLGGVDGHTILFAERHEILAHNAGERSVPKVELFASKLREFFIVDRDSVVVPRCKLASSAVFAEHHSQGASQVEHCVARSADFGLPLKWLFGLLEVGVPDAVVIVVAIEKLDHCRALCLCFLESGGCDG